MATTEVEYPEHEKLSKVKDDSQTIGYFLEWFFSEYDVYPKGVVTHFMEFTEGIKGVVDALAGDEIPVEYPIRVCGDDRTFNEILANHYGIDYDKLMDEKEEMYQSLRAAANG